MPLNEIASHRPQVRGYDELTSISSLPVASAYRCATEGCAVPPQDIGIQAVSLSPYCSGVAGPHHTHLLVSPALLNMLLFPFFPFGSGSVVRLGVISPERRPTVLAIHSVRDTAHPLNAHGSLVMMSDLGNCSNDWHSLNHRFPCLFITACRPSPFSLSGFTRITLNLFRKDRTDFHCLLCPLQTAIWVL
jgi:hypothetical protein